MRSTVSTYPKLKQATGIFLFWTVIALFFVVQNYVQAVANARTFPLIGYTIHQFSNFWLWALFTPVVFGLINRVEEQGSLFKRVSVILGGGVLLSFLHSTLFNLASIELRYTILEIEQLRGYLTLDGLLPIVASAFFSSFLTYLLVAGGIYAWQLFVRSKEQDAVNARLAANLNQTRLLALKGQLHPHFLFNTLNSIASLTEINPSLARKMISKLSALLRYSLDHTNRQFAPVEEELAITRKYLEIEQVRFGDRLEFHFEVDPELLRAEIPFLLLQPLVENSIIHGVSPHRRKGVITIACRRKGDRVRVVISDNGNAPDRIDETLYEGGLGLSLTRKRMKELYGDDYGMNLDLNEQGGLEIALTFPHREFREQIRQDTPLEVIDIE